MLGGVGVFRRGEIILPAETVTLRTPRPSDYSQWAMLRRASRAFLQPWEPVWPEDDLTRRAYGVRLKAYARERNNGVGCAFFVFRNRDGVLVGGVSLSNIRRGPAQAATIGYWIGQPFARRGYTLSAVNRLLKFAYDDLGLHRVEAAALPENVASRALLSQAGFCEEGLAKSYLKINNKWADHVLYGRLRP